MSDEPFLGELRIFSFNFPPKGWALCNGQLLPINQNQALFSLLGTQFGGNGQTTFALPDLRGRLPIHMGTSFTIGQAGGEPAHTVTAAEMPTHAHQLQATTTQAGATTNSAQPARMLAQSNFSPIYGSAGNLTAMAPTALTNVGGSQAHTNMAPFLVLTFCIALIGIFPSRN